MTELTKRELSDDFSAMIDQHIEHNPIQKGSVIKARVIGIDNDMVYLDTGLKSESIVSIKEFTDENGIAPLAVGDQVSVMVETLDNGFGETCLSREKAIKHESWHSLENSMENQEVVKGVIAERVKGGFTVLVSGIRAFLPGSQVDLRSSKDMNPQEGDSLDFKVVKMDKKRNNIVVSRRAVMEDMFESREEILSQLTEGAEIRGVVKNLTDYGAFIDLGGIDGLLHITDMAWKRVKHPGELIKVGDEITVKVLSYDKEKQRVSLGMKQLSGDPWNDLSKRHPLQSRLFGRVTNITEYGCFVEIEEGIEGLVHMSEMDWTNKNIHPAKVVEVDQQVEVMVLDIDESRRRISLGLKQCKPNPWLEFSTAYTKDQVITGKVKSITDFGVFIGLDGGIDGLVHLNDISWVLPGEQAVREYKKGQEVKALIISIDPERERISLGIKNLEEDPFEEFFMSHPKGSKVVVKVEESNDRRVIVRLSDESDKVLKGSLKRDDFSAEPKAGDEVEAYIITTERKNYLVPLSLGPVRYSGEDKPTKTSSTQPAKTTFGDLLKNDKGNES